MLQQMYPDFHFLPWKFQQSPPRFWSNVENHKAYLSWLEHQLNIINKEDWYNISRSQILQHHGSNLLLRYYNGSILTMLQRVYPDFHFLPWKFKQVPQGYWADNKNLRHTYRIIWG